MLLVKCDQCGASYKLSEDLYQRKAAGFGVVVTCRRCKKEIHVAEGASTGDDASVNELPTSPTNEPPEAKPARQSPAAPPVTPNALPPTQAKAIPAGRKATLLGVQAPSPPAPKAQPKPPSPGPPPRPGPRVVALSPGLLGTVTAMKERALPPPVVPKAQSAAAAMDVPSSERDTVPPPDSAAPTPRPPSSAADSEIPIESRDFLGESAPNASPGVDPSIFMTESLPAVPEKEPEPKKRLPTAPAVKRPGAAAAAAKSDEQPSTTGTPKLDTLVHGPAVALDQKKGDVRRRLASGDLTDDFMSADLGFDAPDLAPPDQAALLRAPISSRPATSNPAVTAPSDAKSISPKSAQPVIIKKAAASGSGRGKMAVVALLVLGAGALLFRDRLSGKQPPGEPEPAAAVAKAPEPPQAEPAAPAAATSANTDGLAEPLPEPEPAPPGSATAPTAPADPALASRPATATPSPGVASPTPGAQLRPAPSDPVPATKPAEPTATGATPAPTAPREARGEPGTEPFNATAARAALDASAGQASTCRKPGDPSGVAVVIITFAPTGRVTSANISGPPFAATPTGGCIASTLRKTRVPAFAGDLVTVKKTVTIH